jgi:hypothetical protein
MDVEIVDPRATLVRRITETEGSYDIEQAFFELIA